MRGVLNLKLRMRLTDLRAATSDMGGATPATEQQVSNLTHLLENARSLANSVQTMLCALTLMDPDAEETSELLDIYAGLAPKAGEKIAAAKAELKKMDAIDRSKEEQLAKLMPNYKFLHWSGKKEEFEAILQNWKPLQNSNISELYKANTIRGLVSDQEVKKLIQHTSTYSETIRVLRHWYGSEESNLQRLLQQVKDIIPPKTPAQEFQNLNLLFLCKRKLDLMKESNRFDRFNLKTILNKVFLPHSVKAFHLKNYQQIEKLKEKVQEIRLLDGLDAAAAALDLDNIENEEELAEKIEQLVLPDSHFTKIFWEHAQERQFILRESDSIQRLEGKLFEGDGQKMDRTEQEERATFPRNHHNWRNNAGSYKETNQPKGSYCVNCNKGNHTTKNCNFIKN